METEVYEIEIYKSMNIIIIQNSNVKFHFIILLV